ncbi:hypothetical protein MSPP1_002571 [Malassezia sp. CBS 17886]|nr:hypothetical protein MSPP1_002571 [Malassezia sp. CBS 17886]
MTEEWNDEIESRDTARTDARADEWESAPRRDAEPEPERMRDEEPERMRDEEPERVRGESGNSRSGDVLTPRDAAQDEGEVNPGNNLHISSLSRQAQDSDLEALFAPFGPMIKAQVMRDPHTRDARGFGFVTYENVDDANAAVEALNGHELLGRPIGVQRARRARARVATPGQYLGPPKRDGPGRPNDFGGRGYDRHDRYDRYGRSDRYDRRPRDYPPRDYPSRDYPSRDYPSRDYPPRDYPPRDYARRDYPQRDDAPRDYPPRDYPPRSRYDGPRDRSPPGRGRRSYDERAAPPPERS